MANLNIDVKWLQDFLTVAEMGNFTRAAEALNSSQTALSRRVQSLELWLGVTLIDRGVFPTRLTPAGEQFRAHASEILKQVIDARGELTGTPSRDHIRVALPYALATACLPQWWTDWARDRSLSCSVIVGNVHDMILALVAGNVDVLICFHSAQQPIQLDAEHYERIVLRSEYLRPYASKSFIARHGKVFPGRRDQPVPLLMYSPGVYFGRLVELALETSPVVLNVRRVIESDMSDVLRDMALAGHGVAWLPDCSVAVPAAADLVAVDDGELSLNVTTIAFKNRSNDRASVTRSWERLTLMAGDHSQKQRKELPAEPLNIRSNFPKF